jgi:hypothetical protein
MIVFVSLLCTISLSNANNFVFSFAANYGFAKMALFVNSAVLFAKNSTIRIGVLPHQLRSLPKAQHGVYKNVEFVAVEHRFYAEARQWFMYRHEVFVQWLKDLSPTDDWVITADSRDSIFQADPFASTEGFAELNFFTEDAVLGVEMINTGWITSCPGLGLEAAIAVNHKPVICAGNLLGRPPALARLMREILDRPTCIDQGVVNYVAHHDPWVQSVSRIWLRGTGPVNTIGFTGLLQEPPVRLDENGNVLNLDGITVSPILHQYNGPWSIAIKRRHFAAWDRAVKEQKLSAHISPHNRTRIGGTKAISWRSKDNRRVAHRNGTRTTRSTSRTPLN